MTEGIGPNTPSPTFKGRATRADQRRKLVEAAYDLVGEVGISGLRTRDITTRAGVHLATFHYCYDSKQALLTDLYPYIVTRFRADTSHFFRDAESVAATLASNRAMRKYLTAELPISLRVWQAFVAEASIDDTVRVAVREHFREMRARFDDLIRAGRAEGLFTDMSDKPVISGALAISLYIGVLTQLAIDPDAFSVDEYEDAVEALMGYGGSSSNRRPRST